MKRPELVKFMLSYEKYLFVSQWDYSCRLAVPYCHISNINRSMHLRFNMFNGENDAGSDKIIICPRKIENYYTGPHVSPMANISIKWGVKDPWKRYSMMNIKNIQLQTCFFLARFSFSAPPRFPLSSVSACPAASSSRISSSCLLRATASWYAASILLLKHKHTSGNILNQTHHIWNKEL